MAYFMLSLTVTGRHQLNAPPAVEVTSFIGAASQFLAFPL